MGQSAEKNYYELLNVLPGATQQEIEEAYRRARAIYGEDSLASYSLYSQEERESMLETIGEAYKTLTDSSKRNAYDAKFSDFSEKEHRQIDIESGNIKDISKIIAFKHSIRFKKPLVSMDAMEPLTANQYRILYTKLEHISVRNSYKAFAVTSAVKGEGKTITSLNLAYVMANDFRKRVVLVECDLKNPSLSPYLTESDNSYDLIAVIKGEIDLHAAMIQLEQTSLYFLPVRQISKNSIELINSQRMKGVLNTLKAEFDYVLIDCPPILPLADMNIISKIADGVVLVVMAGKTPKDIVLKAAQSLNSANIAGIVLNGANTLLKKYYY